jgi:hypothetical protein
MGQGSLQQLGARLKNMPPFSNTSLGSTGPNRKCHTADNDDSSVNSSRH